MWRNHALRDGQPTNSVAIALCAFVFLFGFRPAGAESLSQFAADAFAHDAKLASAEASYRAGLEKEPEARAALLPHLGLTQSDFKNAIHVPGQPAAPYSTTGATLSLNQSIFNWDDWQAWQQSKLSVADAGLAFSSAKQDLLLRVAQAYFDALAAKDNFSLAQQHQRSVNEQLALTKRSFALGAATIVDLNEAQAGADSALSDLVQAQSTLDRRYAALQKIVGHPVDSIDPIDADANVSRIIADSPDPWISDAMSAKSMRVICRRCRSSATQAMATPRSLTDKPTSTPAPTARHRARSASRSAFRSSTACRR
ncbi:TolC family protein [Burkholderia sp. R-70211]|nr:TolC family protein [Burkholderia sp. R-70211]